MKNPWKLTIMQCQIMAAITHLGCIKAVAMTMGVSEQSAAQSLRRARARMGARTLVHQVLAWDRWVREQRESA